MSWRIAMALAAGGAQAAPCDEAACDFAVLAPYFAKVAARPERGRPVHILQIGDSHTAGDAVTGAWRRLLQAGSGSGGRGVLAPGRPYDGYLTRGVTAAMSPGWQVSATFGRGSAAPRPPLGIAGFSLTALVPGARIALTADADQLFDRFVLCAVAAPGAGSLSVRFGAGTAQRFDYAADAPRPVCRTLATDGPQGSVEIVADGAPVTLTSWATFRDAGGIALSNVGVVGSQLVHFGRTDDAVLAAEFAAYRPDLIVLAFGTNEGFSPRFYPEAYEADLRRQVARIRGFARGVPMLLLGAPDALSRQPALRANADGAPVDCVAGDARPLFAPPALAQVRSVQRRVAHELGVAFWDWQARMGGACAAQGWVAAQPPLMRGDFVHFTSAGGAAIARLLQADLEAAARR